MSVGRGPRLFIYLTPGTVFCDFPPGPTSRSCSPTIKTRTRLLIGKGN